MSTELNRSSPFVGVGYRGPLAAWIDARPAELECLEITAEHFFDDGDDRLQALAKDYPLSVHGLGLSLGTPGALDAETLANFKRVADAADAKWVSEHVAFTRTAEVDLGHLNPLPPTQESLKALVDHTIELRETCGRPLVLENITSALRIEGEMTEPEFLNALCDRAGCGLLLDATNLFINSRNHGFDAGAWLREIEPSQIRQTHVVGYSEDNGRLHDKHCEAIQEDLLELVAEVVAYGNVEAIFIERDGKFPPVEELAEELRRLKKVATGRGRS